MGMYITFGRFIYKKKMKLHTYYAVTNKRIIIYKNYKKEKINEIWLFNTNSVTIEADKNGNGTITFDYNNAPLAYMYRMYANTGMEIFMYGMTMYAFYDVDDVRNIYEIVGNSIKNSRNEWHHL
jgi:hypothetical protein